MLVNQPNQPNRTFQDLVEATRAQREVPVFNGTLICFDPGETTGYAIFNRCDLEDSSQLATKDFSTCMKLIYDELRHHQSLAPKIQVVMEDYKVYGWKTDSHAWADLHTPKLIGGICTVCELLNIPYHMQMAHQAKAFCTDKKLKDWGMYQVGKQHARDAIRHGCYYLLFNKP